jgi:hypothetical protein
MEFREVSAECRSFVENLDMSRRHDLALLTSKLMRAHSDISGKDAEFHLCCSYRALRHELREQLNRYRPPAEDRQLTFEGFPYLQQSYVLKREGVEVSVPTDQASDDELLGKADEYESMGETLIAHALDIRRYVRVRTRKSAA